MTITHQQNKQHQNINVLSHLFLKKKSQISILFWSIKNCKLFSVILIEIHSWLYKQIHDCLKTDSYFQKIYNKFMIFFSNINDSQYIYHDFHWDSDQKLLFYFTEKQSERLCIFQKLYKQVLKQTYNYYTYDNINQSDISTILKNNLHSTFLSHCWKICNKMFNLLHIQIKTI